MAGQGSEISQSDSGLGLGLGAKLRGTPHDVSLYLEGTFETNGVTPYMSPNTIFIPSSIEIWFGISGLMIESLTSAAFPTLIATRSGKALEWMASTGFFRYSPP